MTNPECSCKDIIRKIEDKINRIYGVKAKDASTVQMYNAVCNVLRDLLAQKRINFKKSTRAKEAKQVYYMSMEFLLGRSLKNHLFNLKLTEVFREAVSEMGFNLGEIFEIEPDAGLGNGGLGRLAAAYLDSLTSCSYRASGFSIKYDYGIFKQKIVDGWQIEMPDYWLENGEVWLSPRVDDTFEVKFGGTVEQNWVDGKLKINYKDQTTIYAVPYDMFVSGYNTDAVNTLRLWTAKAPVDFDLALFSRGEYLKAMENKALAESISKVLYPADNHIEGKSLRLKQQYFFVSASIQSIIKHHLKNYDSLDSLSDMVSIHINDTHPSLCIPELMRILVDEYDYGWDTAWNIVKKTFSYTNHTVMAEALERWPQSLFETLLPRIYEIILEINQRFCAVLWDMYPNDWDRVSRNAIISHGEIKMANLCVCASHTVNGVSALHSEILKSDIFRDYYKLDPKVFTNVTNGITHRRWLNQANPELSSLVYELIGNDYVKTADLSKLMNYIGDRSVLERLERIKLRNKQRLTAFIERENGVKIDTSSIFDVQVKRLHEYKRQLLNALHIIDLYFKLKDNPDLKVNPRTFIFSAKAASSYYMAKQIIRLICMLGKVINNDPDIKNKLKVVFLENYRVSLAEIIMPGAEVSEQISVAGKEASGTGNMKFMINGAVTVGTMDGANVEIHELVGDENIFIFGLRAEEVQELYCTGYAPTNYYNTNPDLKRVIDSLHRGFGGVSFSEIADSLLIGRNGMADPYMVLADFNSYVTIHNELDKAYNDRERWNRMSLINIAKSGFFTSDRSVKEYADRIWNIRPIYKD
ncbi:MAG: glycogen/starch/alpha-glucan phosphorylase [Christensenellales bacterium]|jgi:starch phosphorylase